jgi:hypothetical protein
MEARENCKNMAASVLIPIKHERRAVTLDALEGELLASSEHDEYARCSLYLVDFIKELTCLKEELAPRLDYITDRPVWTQLHQVVADIEPLIFATRKMLQERVPNMRVPGASAPEWNIPSC